MLNGTDFTIYIPSAAVDNDDASTEWQELAMSTSVSFTFNSDGIDTSTKDSSGWSENLQGVRSITANFDSLIPIDWLINVIPDNDSASAPAAWLYYYLTNGNKIKVAIGCDDPSVLTSNTFYIYVDGYISSLEYTGDNESTATFSGTFVSDGAISKGDVFGSSTIDDSSGEYPE